MHFAYLKCSNLQKTSKIIIPEDSYSKSEYNLHFLELKKSIAAILKCLLPANLKQVC